MKKRTSAVTKAFCDYIYRRSGLRPHEIVFNEADHLGFKAGWNAHTRAVKKGKRK